MEYIPVGKLNKSFGTKGQIRVVPEKAFKADLERSGVWFVSKGGDIIPYFVEAIDHSVHFLVKFEDINSPEDAKQITGGGLLLRAKDVSIKTDSEEDDLDKLVGFTIITNQNNEIGVIQKIEEYPQQLMATVLQGNSEFLIPMLPEFIISIDIDNQNIDMQLPEGLVESQL